MSESFDVRWGILKEVNTNSTCDKIGTYMILHIVFLFVMFCLMKPPFLTVQYKQVEMPSLSLSKVLLFSLISGTFTFVWYAYTHNVPLQSVYQDWISNK